MKRFLDMKKTKPILLVSIVFLFGLWLGARHPIMKTSPPPLKDIVQRMIDAGENDENIATVIRAKTRTSEELINKYANGAVGKRIFVDVNGNLVKHEYQYDLTDGRYLILQGNTEPADAEVEQAAKKAGVTVVVANP